MLFKSQNVILSIITAGLVFGSATVLADEDSRKFSDPVVNKKPCSVNPAYPDGISGYDGRSLTGILADEALDAEFGPGAQELTQCLKNRKDVKLVVRVNDTFRMDAFGQARLNKPMFLSNVDKFINQYQNTHGLEFGKGVDVRVILGGSGAALATTGHKIFAGAAKKWNAANPDNPMPVSLVNPYVDIVKDAMKLGITFYLCQEASRTLGITMKNKIPGISLFRPPMQQQLISSRMVTQFSSPNRNQ